MGTSRNHNKLWRPFTRQLNALQEKLEFVISSGKGIPDKYPFLGVPEKAFRCLPGTLEHRKIQGLEIAKRGQTGREADRATNSA